MGLIAKSLTLMSYGFNYIKSRLLSVVKSLNNIYMLQRSPRLVVWTNVKFLYFYVVPAVPAVCRLRGLPFHALVLPIMLLC